MGESAIVCDSLSHNSYACREHSTVLVAGQVAIEGFLKMWGTNKVLLGTSRRCLQHDSIIGDINWIPIEVGRGKRYTADERIQNFLQQTALPPATAAPSPSLPPLPQRVPRLEAENAAISQVVDCYLNHKFFGSWWLGMLFQSTFQTKDAALKRLFETQIIIPGSLKITQ